MGPVRCKCGNTYFARVNINQFKEHSASLHMSMHEIEPDHDIKIYQCICCKNYMMPPLDYFNSAESDKELYSIIESALLGKVVEKKVRHKSKPLHSGTAAFVGGQDRPEEHGKFVKVE